MLLPRTTSTTYDKPQLRLWVAGTNSVDKLSHRLLASWHRCVSSAEFASRSGRNVQLTVAVVGTTPLSSLLSWKSELWGGCWCLMCVGSTFKSETANY